LHLSGTLLLVTVSAWNIAPVVIATAFVVFSTLASASSPNLPKRTLFQAFITSFLHPFLVSLVKVT
jgi:hypothetical protein